MQSSEQPIPQWIKDLSTEERRMALVIVRGLLEEARPKGATNEKISHIPNILDARLTRRGLLGVGGLMAATAVAKVGEQSLNKLAPLVSEASLETSEMASMRPNGPQDAPAPEELKAWEPQEGATFDDNGFLRIEPSADNWPGMLNFFYKDEQTGQWVQHNNIVPLNFVNGIPSNAEAEKAKITREVFTDADGKKKAKYQYSKMANGAHYYLVVNFEPGKKEVALTARLNPDSAPIQEFTLGNFLGIEDGVNDVDSGTGKIYHATDYAPVNDGNFLPGLGVNIPMKENRVEFKGSKWRQYQELVGAPVVKTDIEIRRHGWVPWQNDQAKQIGRNWVETVHIFTNKPDGATWKFGMNELPEYTAQKEKNFDEEIKKKTEKLTANAIPEKAREAASRNIPLIAKALRNQGIYSNEVLAYALARTQVETWGTFEPIEEVDGRQQAKKLKYKGGENYFGRGFIQLTHITNYTEAGRALNLDLVNQPDLALEPNNAAKIEAWYFKRYGVAKLAQQGKFYEASIPINGTTAASEIAASSKLFLEFLK